MNPNFNLTWVQWVSVVALSTLAVSQFAQHDITGGIASLSAALAIFGIGTAISQVKQSVGQVAESNVELKKQLQSMQRHK